MSRYPAYCCPKCGECVGYVGRAFMAVLGKYAPHGYIDACRPEEERPRILVDREGVAYPPITPIALKSKQGT